MNRLMKPVIALVVALFAITDSVKAQTPDYTIECKFEIEQVAAGLCFGMTSPGNFYMWQLNTERGYARFRPHKWTNNSPACLKEEDLDDLFEEGEEYDLRIEITDNGTVATTYINDQLVDRSTGKFPLGRMGFRASKAESSSTMESSYWDDFKVTVNGQVQSAEDFANGNNLFDGGEVVDGRLYIVGTHPADKYVWQYEVSEYPDYIVDLDFQIKDHCFGLAFAKSPTTGSFYMWQINKESKLNPHFNSGGWTVYPAVDLGEKGVNVSEGEHHLTLKVTNNARRLVTIVDGVEVDSREGSFIYGPIGFRQDALPDNTPEASYMDNLVIKAGDEVLFSEDFNNPYCHPFQHGCPVDGRWLTTGYLASPISWLNADPSASIFECDVTMGKGGFGLMQGWTSNDSFQLWALVGRDGRPALRRHAWRNGGWAYHNAGAERGVNAPIGSLYDEPHHVRLVKQGTTLTYYIDGYMLDRYDQKISNNQDVFDAYYGFRMDEGDFCYVDNMKTVTVTADGEATVILNEDFENGSIFDLPVVELDGSNQLEVRSPGNEMRCVEKSLHSNVAAESKWTTYAPAHTVVVPNVEGVSVMVVENVDRARNCMTIATVAPGTTVAPGEGLLVYAPEGANLTWEYSNAAPAALNNLLTGTTYTALASEVKSDASATLFGLANQATYGTAFYPCDEATLIPANKAVLELGDAATLSVLGIGTEIETGINKLEDITRDLKSGEIYDLQGRRLGHIHGRGLYIIGGKKVLVK